jgi:hypothetical protein
MATQYELTEVWVRPPEEDRGGLRPCTTRACDENAGKRVDEVGRPPAHPHCVCQTALVLEPVGEV